MSYENLKEARVKCVAKERAVKSKGKRGHKRKIQDAALEAEASMSMRKGNHSADERATAADAVENTTGENVLGQFLEQV
jgi:hypothetical protein